MDRVRGEQGARDRGPRPVPRQDLDRQPSHEKGRENVQQEVDPVEPGWSHAGGGPVEGERHAGQWPKQGPLVTWSIPVGSHEHAGQVPDIPHERIGGDDTPVVEDEIATQRREIEQKRENGTEGQGEATARQGPAAAGGLASGSRAEPSSSNCLWDPRLMVPSRRVRRAAST